MKGDHEKALLKLAEIISQTPPGEIARGMVRAIVSNPDPPLQFTEVNPYGNDEIADSIRYIPGRR